MPTHTYTLSELKKACVDLVQNWIEDGRISVIPTARKGVYTYKIGGETFTQLEFPLKRKDCKDVVHQSTQTTEDVV